MKTEEVDAVLADYDDAGRVRLEAEEAKAGITIGSWRTTDAIPWAIAIREGRKLKAALREREERLGRS